MKAKQVTCYYERFCSACGKMLTKTAATTATRCPKCQTAYRREYRRLWQREYRSKKGVR